MLHYKVYQNKSKGNKAFGKWFARATVNQTIDLEKLAEHMANHNTPYSKGAIYGVLTDMVNCIRELVLDGNAVKIPNLAIFSAGLTTKGAKEREAFTPSRNILPKHPLGPSPCPFHRRLHPCRAHRGGPNARGRHICPGYEYRRDGDSGRGRNDPTVAASHPGPSPKERGVKCFKKTNKL